MAGGSPAGVRRARDELVRRAASASTVGEVFGTASRRLRRLVPYDASAWLATDPATGFPTAPSRIEGVRATAELCSAHWRHEFLGGDVNHFRDLLRADPPASALRATVGDPRRSRRFRSFLQPHGFTDELRAVLRVGDTPWGTVTLWRGDGAPFSAQETALVGGLCAALGEAVRFRVRADLPPPGTAMAEPPGLLIFDRAGRLASVNQQAVSWVERLPAEDKVPSSLGLPVPIWLLLVMSRARDSFASGGDGTARTRVRAVDGRWLLCHASTTRAADGSPAETAVVIEPAGPEALAPVVVGAYGLTAREQQIVRRIARGEATEEIARRVHLSPYTVKDHVKSILRKVGVSSRGELVATLYATHYEPAHLASTAHVSQD